MKTPFLETIQRVIDESRLYPDRTGVGRHRIFGAFERYDLKGNTLPADTTTKMFLRTAVREIVAMKNGLNTVGDLGEGFWSRWSPTKEDAEAIIDKYIAQHAVTNGEVPEEHLESAKILMDEEISRLRTHLDTFVGTIGPMYGSLWRNFPRATHGELHWITSFDDVPSDKVEKYKERFMTELLVSQEPERNTKENFEAFCLGMFTASFDQLAKVVKELKTDPYSSRHRITAFHPDLIGPTNVPPKENVLDGYAALAPCHTFFQFMVTTNDEGKDTLNCMLYMSSSDVLIGRAYNIAQYSLLTIMLAHCLDFEPGEFIITSCDTHIYDNHFASGLKPGAEDQVKREPRPYPTVYINPEKKDFFALTADDIEIVGYNPHEKIHYEVAV